jgi:dTDP-4-amino-4,6-dideoxygalactose transaminase
MQTPYDIIKDKINVTQPSLPNLEEYIVYLREIWDSRWLTNNGKFHQELESALARFLGVKHVSLFANGTLALMSALQALEINGEVITTPYSFVATTNALWWNGIEPVFSDISVHNLNLDPAKIETAITEKTSAIMPVHVYGNPCNLEGIQAVADKHNLKLIYDAAHAFKVDINGNSVLNFGDLSILSFHATKSFNTIEGGAIISHTPEMKQRIDYLKNFGFADEVTVVAPGINAKMNELQAAFGLLQLKEFESNRINRKQITERYRSQLTDVEGIELLNIPADVSYNYSYFPIFVKKNYPLNRDELYHHLKKNNIYGRRYFYPLISEFKPFRHLPSAKVENLPVAVKAANEVICLPIYPDLSLDDVEMICKLIRNFNKQG